MRKKAGFLFAIMAVWMLTLFSLKETVHAAETEQTEEVAVVEEGVCGDSLTWRIDEEGVLFISGTGDMTDYEEPEEAIMPESLMEEETVESLEDESDNLAYINKAPWGKYYDIIVSVVIEEGVTSIGTWSFCNCYNIQNIYFLSETNLLTIKEGAFYYCSGLTALNIPASVISVGNEAFCCCENLTELNIPDSVTEIGEAAFAVTNVINVELSNNVQNIGASVFASCYSLESIKLPENLTVISETLFSGCSALKEIVIPETVISIGEYAFEYCDSLEEVIVPESVTELGAGAFYGCSNLKKVVLPENVKSIGSYAFYRCGGLTEIIIPEKVEEIGGYAFYECNGLTELVIPESVGTLGKYSFYGCSSLQKLDLNGKIASCGSYVFAYCKNLSEVSIAEGITVIGDYMFYYCDGLKNIVLPDTITTIGNSAFAYCTRMSDGSSVNWGQTNFTWTEIEASTGLESVTFSKNLTEIGEDAFSHCFKITSIEIPDTVKEIKDRAFKSCFSLQEIQIGNSVETIGEQVFATCKIEKVELPDTLNSLGAGAFGNCYFIEEIVLPEKISVIYENTFLGCSAIQKVYYGGTNAQWKEMSITEEGNETFLDALIYCSDGPLGMLDKNDGASGEGVLSLDEIQWFTSSGVKPMEGMPLKASNVYFRIQLTEQFMEQYESLFFGENDEIYLNGVVYLWDSNGNRVASLAFPRVRDDRMIIIYMCSEFPSTDIVNPAVWEQDVFLPNQTLEIQIRDIEQTLLVSAETKSISFERFGFENFAERIPDDMVENVFGEKKAKQLIKKCKAGIGNNGVCFGMALGASLVNYGEIPISYFGDCIILDQVERDTKMPQISNVKNAEEFVMLCHLLQETPLVQETLEASHGYGIAHLQIAIDEYKKKESAMPVIGYTWVNEEGQKCGHAVNAYDYRVEENYSCDGESCTLREIYIYNSSESDYRINSIKIYEFESGDFKWISESSDIDTLQDSDNFEWLIPAAGENAFLSNVNMACKALVYTEDSLWPSFNGVKNQKIDWMAGEDASADENEGQLTWVWGDGTVSVEKQTEDVSLADDYALYTVKAAEFVEFALQNGNTAETAIEGEGNLQESCEYSTGTGDVAVEFTGTSDAEVKMKYSGTTVEFTGIKEGIITVTYEDGRVWSKTIGTDGESSAILYADGTNQPTDSNGEIWADKPVDPPVVEESEVVRISGTTRYETGYKVADALKAELGVDKFDAIVVATGKNFADALAGSYLAVCKDAPILLTNGKADNVAQLHEYIKSNVSANGTVYILGGEGAVPATVEAIDGYEVVRLAGKSRYETNLAILAEAGIEGDELIVATGKTFADSLSASAAKLPILLVKPGTVLSDEAKGIVVNMSKFYIIGGEGAVSADIAAELAAYGEVVRVSGKTRYETSVAVANTFFTDVEEAVIASGKNFPDGLCGGPLAAAMNAPLILTADGKTEAAADYMAENAIEAGFVLGGTGALADESVADVFSLGNTEEIVGR